jgi:hypothetical protein
MKLIVLSLTAAAAVTVPSLSSRTGVQLNGFTPGGLELTAANQNHWNFRKTGARASVRVVATASPFSVGAR